MTLGRGGMGDDGSPMRGVRLDPCAHLLLPFPRPAAPLRESSDYSFGLRLWSRKLRLVNRRGDRFPTRNAAPYVAAVASEPARPQAVRSIHTSLVAVNRQAQYIVAYFLFSPIEWGF